MNIRKTYISAVITAAVVIAIATTTTAFPSATIFATPLTPPEQVGNNTTTNATTSTAGQQSTIYITKHGSNSYVISGEMSSVGSFDTTYRIAGERSAIRSAENLVLSTITVDFMTSPTIGYVTVGNTTVGNTTVGNTTTTTSGQATTTTLPNPFASPEQITERITNELRRVISEAENNTSQGQYVEIKCGFGMTLEDMQCHYVPLPQAGQG
jgi:hypothetical protein